MLNNIYESASEVQHKRAKMCVCFSVSLLIDDFPYEFHHRTWSVLYLSALCFTFSSFSLIQLTFRQIQDMWLSMKFFDVILL